MKKPIKNMAVLTSTWDEDSQTRKVLTAILRKKLPVKIAVLIYDQQSPNALKWAENNDIPIVFVNRANKKPEKVDKEILTQLKTSKVDFVQLIGWKGFISSVLLEKYRNKIMNIHPSLMPAFTGKFSERVHEAVIEAGVAISGCTEHFVNEILDGGPIILQKAVPVNRTNDTTQDTSVSLKRKVQRAEIGVILESIRLLIEGRIKVTNNKVIILPKSQTVL